MNLKPELLAVMTQLGVTEPELAVLASRMTFAVSSLDAQLNALNAQIDQLTQQRDAVLAELQAGQVTMNKLVNPVPPSEPVPEAPAE
jgi:homogentisate 1,2-dioxygenase